MPANANDLIVIGIGPGSEILTLLTFGLGIGEAVVVTGVFDLVLPDRSLLLSLLDRSTNLEVPDRPTP